MQPFSFPILERKEILSYLLADTGIILEEQQLIKPTMEAVWPVYENLVLNIMGITRCAQHFSPPMAFFSFLVLS
jgi:hypothetical protein